MKTVQKTKGSTKTSVAPAEQRIAPGGERRSRKITPFLWFADNAEEAAEFYTSVFRNSRIVTVTRYSAASAEASGRPRGSVMTVAFQIEGQDFIALNGGPMFQFTPAVSFVVNCETQEEVDELWEKLCEDGEPGQCGWLKDRYGVSWQIVPAGMGELLKDDGTGKSERVMKTLLQMGKIKIEALKQVCGQ